MPPCPHPFIINVCFLISLMAAALCLYLPTFLRILFPQTACKTADNWLSQILFSYFIKKPNTALCSTRQIIEILVDKTDVICFVSTTKSVGFLVRFESAFLVRFESAVCSYPAWYFKRKVCTLLRKDELGGNSSNHLSPFCKSLWLQRFLRLSEV